MKEHGKREILEKRSVTEGSWTLSHWGHSEKLVECAPDILL